MDNFNHYWWMLIQSLWFTAYIPHIIELDDGKIGTGKPNPFDGKKHGFWCRFSQQNQSIDHSFLDQGTALLGLPSGALDQFWIRMGWICWWPCAAGANEKQQWRHGLTGEFYGYYGLWMFIVAICGIYIYIHTYYIILYRHYPTHCSL